jgi:hypothetical protein
MFAALPHKFSDKPNAYTKPECLNRYLVPIKHAHVSVGDLIFGTDRRARAATAEDLKPSDSRARAHGKVQREERHTHHLQFALSDAHWLRRPGVLAFLRALEKVGGLKETRTEAPIFFPRGVQSLLDPSINHGDGGEGFGKKQEDVRKAGRSAAYVNESRVGKDGSEAFLYGEEEVELAGDMLGGTEPSAGVPFSP